MGIALVEVIQGRRRFRPLGVAALFAACCPGFFPIPSLIFWLAFGDLHLIRFSLGFGFALGGVLFGLILARARLLPPGKRAPAAAGGVDD